MSTNVNDNLNLNDLRLFANVVEHGGFSAASRVLGLPKSTLSKRVAALEEQMSARLLQRNARHIAPTELGATILEHARTMLHSVEAVKAAVAERQAEPAGLVRLTCSTITAQYHLAPLWPDFVRLFPKVSLAVHCTDRMVDLISEGFDLALRDHLAPLEDSDLVAVRLGREPDYLVTSASWAASHPVTHPEDLAALDGLYCSGSGQPTVWRLENGHGEQHRLSLPIRFGSDDPGSVVTMALAGLGVARLPRCICAPLLASGELVRLLPDWSVPGPITSLLYPHRRGQLPATRAAIAFLTERLRPQLDA